MSTVTLSKTDRWQLKHADQDVRGQTVYDTNEQPIGRVTRMVADTSTRQVERLVLDGGDEVSVGDVDLRDGAVRLKEGPAPEAAAATSTADGRRPQYADHEEAFRTHYRDTYGESRANYAAYEPAYRHGFRHALRDEYREKPYDEVEPEMRRSYEKQHGEATYADVREAARRAYRRARRHG